MSKLPIPERALADCGAILGRRGAGKSGTGRVLLEHELDASHRCCVIDPKGDWFGIRANKDGKPSRFHIPVFGGAHADVPIDDAMGAQLGEIVATSSSSSVIDLSAFSVAGMRRFMSATAKLEAENARLTARNGFLEHRHDRDRTENDQLMAVLAGVQDLIGARIGSMEIVPLPAGADPADYTMMIDADGKVRPFPRQPGAGPRVADARRRIADAPVQRAVPAAGLEPAAIAALMDAKLLGEIASDVPAVRRIVAAIALGGALDRAAIADAAGVSITSSHLGVGLRRLVERGILDQHGEQFVLAGHHHHGGKND